MEAAPADGFEFQALQNAAQYRRAILAEFGPWLRGRVLEVGAGVGQLTAELLSRPGIEELMAVEPDAAYCQALRRLTPAAGVRFTVVEGTSGNLTAPGAWHAIV